MFLLIKKYFFYFLFFIFFNCDVKNSSFNSVNNNSQSFKSIDVSGDIKANLGAKNVSSKVVYLDYTVDFTTLGKNNLDNNYIDYSFGHHALPKDMFFQKINNRTVRVWISNTNRTKEYNGNYKLSAKVHPYPESDRISIGDSSYFIHDRKDFQSYQGTLNLTINLKLEDAYPLTLTSSVIDNGFRENQNLPIKFTQPLSGTTILDVYDFPKISITNIFGDESILLILWSTNTQGIWTSNNLGTTTTESIKQLRGLWIITNEIISRKVGTSYITNSIDNVETNRYTNLVKQVNFIVPLKESSSSPADISSKYITTINNYLPPISTYTNRRDYFYRAYAIDMPKDTLKKEIEDNLNKDGFTIINGRNVVINYKNKLEAIEFYFKDKIIQKSKDLKFYFKPQKAN